MPQLYHWRQWSYFQTIGLPRGFLQNQLMKFKSFYSKHELQLQSSRDFTRTEDIKDRAQSLLAKEQALQAAREKVIKEKERLSHEIMQYGLWQTDEDISSGLAK